MTLVAIRKKLHRYIDRAKDQKVKAFYSLVEEVIRKDEKTWTREFIEEQEGRAADFESGKVKVKSWNSVKRETRKASLK